MPPIEDGRFDKPVRILQIPHCIHHIINNLEAKNIM
jgi:hypothetical protein